ncbi:MAG TPA: hypothetical protein VF590_09660 [Isosphaeraceae bacterium]|jgi:hypothetical protein
MTSNLDQVSLASLPAPALAVLAPLRREPGITVTLRGDRAWVRWEPGAEAVLRRVLPVPGVELYVLHEGRWHRPGHHLPAAVPEAEASAADEALPLHRAITPVPIRATPPPAAAPEPARLGLVRTEGVRPATALRCLLEELSPWAESATTAEIRGLRAARSGAEVLLRGERLPALAAGQRFWGERVLVPLGFRADPDLPEPALQEALGVPDEAILLLEAEGFEAIPRAAFRPLTRAGLRRALGGACA